MHIWLPLKRAFRTGGSLWTALASVMEGFRNPNLFSPQGRPMVSVFPDPLDELSSRKAKNLLSLTPQEPLP